MPREIPSLRHYLLLLLLLLHWTDSMETKEEEEKEEEKSWTDESLEADQFLRVSFFDQEELFFSSQLLLIPATKESEGPEELSMKRILMADCSRPLDCRFSEAE